MRIAKFLLVPALLTACSGVRPVAVSRPVPLPAAPAAPAAQAAPEHVFEVLSDVYTIDKKYRSMKGPASMTPIRIEPAVSELLWMTGYSASVVGEDGSEGPLIEFMCHSNLDLDPKVHGALMNGRRGINPRVFTVSQGQTEVTFPEGFGIPVLSDESFELTTQVLNLNSDQCDMKVRHRTRIRYVRDRELTLPMRPLYQEAIFGMKLLSGKDGRYSVDPDDAECKASCLPGQNADHTEYHDPYGRTFTGHWVVLPGREISRTPLDGMLVLSHPETVHAIAVHLHPFAVSLELWDATERRSVWKSLAQNPRDRIGLERVETYSSAVGFALLPKHHYELVSVYDNPTKEPQDSMAVMFLYIEDRQFRAEKFRSASAAPRPPAMAPGS